MAKKVKGRAARRREIPPATGIIDAICADIELGISLRAALRAAQVPIAVMRAGLASRSKLWSAVRLRIEGSQHARRREAAARVNDAAAQGAPSALAIISQQLLAPPEQLDEAPKEHVAYLRWRLSDVRRRLSSADGIAYNQLLARETDLLSQIATAEQSAGDDRERSPAEVLAAEQVHAREAADLHLQVYVVEYLRRHSGIFLATNDGRIEIVA